MPTINGTTPPPPRPPKNSQLVKKVTQPTSPSRGALDNPDVMDESSSGWTWSNPKIPLPPRVKEYVTTFHTLNVVDEGPLPTVTRKIQQNPELYESLANAIEGVPRVAAYMFSDELTDEQKQRLTLLSSAVSAMSGSTEDGVVSRQKPSSDKRKNNTETKQDIINFLAAYGIIVSPTGPWTLPELSIIKEAVEEAGRRLSELHQRIYGNNNTTGAEVFKRVFSDGDGFNFFRDKRNHPKDWAAENSVRYDKTKRERGGDITFFGTNLGNGISNAVPNLNYSAKFLVLHEISHNMDGYAKPPSTMYPVSDEEIAYRRYDRVENLLRAISPQDLFPNDKYNTKENLAYTKEIEDLIKKGEKQAGINKIPTLEDAGFTYGARSGTAPYGPEELVADAIANWLLNSFSDDAYGKIRRRQMDEFMTFVIIHEFGSFIV